jgi:gluconate 2-dehydrogenase alpha chain
MKNLPHVDVAIVGGGWTGLLMAKELGSRTPLSIAVLERGAPRGGAEYLAGMDELDYAVLFKMMQDAAQQTVTFRHSAQRPAFPIREYGSFLPGSGTGGAGEHWNGTCHRPLPDVFEILTRTKEKYGEHRLPDGHSIQDWGLTFSDLEPYYARVDALLGVSGKAGNLHGKLIPGGNPFEGPRSSEYPTPPLTLPEFAENFRKTAASLGYHPYVQPAATISTTYTNPDGVVRPACAYCGFCERFGCMIGAKAQPTNTLLPVIRRHKNISLRTHSWVRKIVHEKNGANSVARGVIYRDESGEEVFQPADLVIIGTWTLNNVRLLLLSGIGQAYNPASGEGTLGRNLTHQIQVAAAQPFFDKPLNRFMGTGAAAAAMHDFDGGVFDHGKLGFIRGGLFEAASTGARPVSTFGTVPPSVKARWGSEWKKAAVHSFDRIGSIAFLAEHMAYKGNFTDLDPTYTDQFGDPLLRLTLNWTDNERKMVEYAVPKAVDIGKAMGAREVLANPGLGDYDATRYQTTHVQGGAIMGASRETSVVNRFLQHWDVPNLFVLGGSAFPQNFSAHPTMTVLALTLHSADAIVNRYLKHPGALA